MHPFVYGIPFVSHLNVSSVQCSVWMLLKSTKKLCPNEIKETVLAKRSFSHHKTLSLSLSQSPSLWALCTHCMHHQFNWENWPHVSSNYNSKFCSDCWVNSRLRTFRRGPRKTSNSDIETPFVRVASVLYFFFFYFFASNEKSNGKKMKRNNKKMNIKSFHTPFHNLQAKFAIFSLTVCIERHLILDDFIS